MLSLGRCSHTFKCVSNVVNLRRVAFRVFRDDDHHFIGADVSRRRMRMRYLAGTKIFRVLLNELNHCITSRLELCLRLCEVGKTAARPATFRRLHFAAAVTYHFQEYLLTIHRIS